MKKLFSLLLVGMIILCASACSPSEPVQGKESAYVSNAELGNGLSLKVTVSPDNEKTKLSFDIETDNSVFSSAVLSAAVNTQVNGDSGNTGPLFTSTLLRNKKRAKLCRLRLII